MLSCDTLAELRAADGSLLCIQDTPEGEVLETRDPFGRILFEYHPATGRGVLHFPASGLSVRSTAGRVEVAARGDLRLLSGGAIELDAGRGVRLSGPQAKLTVDRAVEVEAPALRARVGEMRCEGERLDASVSEARVSFGKLEQVIGRFVQVAGDIYQRIEGLWHSKARRVRAEATESHLVRAGEASVQASGDVNIQGKTINLG